MKNDIKTQRNTYMGPNDRCRRLGPMLVGSWNEKKKNLPYMRGPKDIVNLYRAFFVPRRSAYERWDLDEDQKREREMMEGERKFYQNWLMNIPSCDVGVRMNLHKRKLNALN